MIAELKFLRSENKGLKEEVAANQGTITTQTRLIQIEVERGDFFKSAAEKGIKVGGNDIVLQQKYEQMIGEYKDENSRMRTENDRLRESRNWRSLFTGVGGAGLGYLAGSRTCK